MRVVDAENLGWDAALVEIEGETVLFLDAGLDHEQRMEVLTDTLGGEF